MTNEYLCETKDCNMAVQCKINGKRYCWFHWQELQIRHAIARGLMND